MHETETDNSRCEVLKIVLVVVSDVVVRVEGTDEKGRPKTGLFPASLGIISENSNDHIVVKIVLELPDLVIAVDDDKEDVVILKHPKIKGNYYHEGVFGDNQHLKDAKQAIVLTEDSVINETTD